MTQHIRELRKRALHLRRLAIAARAKGLPKHAQTLDDRAAEIERKIKDAGS
jgi:hypothetical protein